MTSLAKIGASSATKIKEERSDGRFSGLGGREEGESLGLGEREQHKVQCEQFFLTGEASFDISK